jgi:hypothetical protein
MKEAPEIASELRDLLEEIVADPRSAIRFAPRRALRSWFESGETLSGREIDHTRAERHLIEAYREELAQLLLEGARIAYWIAPVFAHRPIGADGVPYDPSQGEPVWKRRAHRSLRSLPPLGGVELLRQCLDGLSPHVALPLARASLVLVRRVASLFCVAATLPRDKPRLSVHLIDRLLDEAPTENKSMILRERGARLCALGALREARESYRASSRFDPTSPIEPCYILNLSCFLDDQTAAMEAASELGRLVGPSDPRMEQAREILTAWVSTQADGPRSVARAVASRIVPAVPEVSRPLCRALQA